MNDNNKKVLSQAEKPMSEKVWVGVNVASKVMGLPIHTLQMHSEKLGLTRWRTTGGHYRYDLEEARMLAPKVYAAKQLEKAAREMMQGNQ